MKVLIYGVDSDKALISNHMKKQPDMAFRLIQYTQTEDYDSFLELMEKSEYEIIIVMMDNAAGMEGARAAKELKPHTPVLWFSNDKNFVAQSYRLGVTYFSVKPIEERIIGLALQRCQRREEC
ncbi:MAG: hypothetical protein IKJ16_05145 [Agathobacter sp.]|nr:hypothetical protein [Agathobacter sp.]